MNEVNVDWNEWNGLMWNGVIGDPNCGKNDDRISIDVWLIVMWNDRNWLESREWMTWMIRWIDWLWEIKYDEWNVMMNMNRIVEYG